MLALYVGTRDLNSGPYSYVASTLYRTSHILSLQNCLFNLPRITFYYSPLACAAAYQTRSHFQVLLASVLPVTLVSSSQLSTQYPCFISFRKIILIFWIILNPRCTAVSFNSGIIYLAQNLKPLRQVPRFSSLLGQTQGKVLLVPQHSKVIKCIM